MSSPVPDGSWADWAGEVLRLMCDADVRGDASKLRAARAAVGPLFERTAGVSWQVSSEVREDGFGRLVVWWRSDCGRSGLLAVPPESLRPGFDPVLLVLFS